MRVQPKIPAKFWYKAHKAIEIDVEDFLSIANNMGFRIRGSHIFRFVQDSRQVVMSSRTQYFEAMKALIPDDEPNLPNVLYAIDQVIEKFGYHLISRLQKLESYYQKHVNN